MSIESCPCSDNHDAPGSSTPLKVASTVSYLVFVMAEFSVIVSYLLITLVMDTAFPY